jgi:hypothetical protein
MTDQTDRERESRETDDTRFERELAEEERIRHEAAARLREDSLTEPE